MTFWSLLAQNCLARLQEWRTSREDADRGIGASKALRRLMGAEQ